MTPAEKLIDWTARWTLLGNHLLCTECMAAQPARDADQPFAHGQCRLAPAGIQYPWSDLWKTLNELPVPLND
ncbi:hypothetical protein [Pseudomonas sp. NA-150]|uniref:hypothetical protein n=1 Tax=Pseudomonas sp. NA-150 TaxID=3367525 RepID=UPI0037CAE7C9